MRLMVCSREALPKFRDSPVTHFVSLVDPDETGAMDHRPPSASHKIQLVFSDLDDIEVKLPQFAKYEPPTVGHVEELVSFGQSLDTLPDWGLLAHCEAGISRSTAAAITILTAAGYKPQTAFQIVRRICPEMLPNRRILRFADRCLDTGGTLAHMAEVHRRKSFARAGYEDPTIVRLREAVAASSTPMGRLKRFFAYLLASPDRRERMLPLAFEIEPPKR